MTPRRNEIQDELVNVASKALTPSAARDKDLIHSHANKSVKTLSTKSTNQSINEEAATGEEEGGDLSTENSAADHSKSSKSGEWDKMKTRKTAPKTFKPHCSV